MCKFRGTCKADKVAIHCLDEIDIKHFELNKNTMTMANNTRKELYIAAAFMAMGMEFADEECDCWRKMCE